jgi:BlaI family penicillinase repressor
MTGSSPETPPAITEAEWTVMRVLWRSRDVALGDVVAALDGQTDWKPRTIQSLLRRLVDKGAVERVVVGRDHRYRPAVEESACRLAASRSFLDRVFDGQLVPFLATFAGRAELTPEDREALRKLFPEEDPEQEERPS